MMQKTVVINVVGLSSRALEHMPFLKGWAASGSVASITPAFPAVTCTAQANYLTGAYPEMHGIVGNGWYYDEECEVKFWKQSNKLVQAPKIWEVLRKENPGFTCANLFWWFNMYSSADISVTPRPQYHADGKKLPDIYTHPASLRDRLQDQLGTFPLFHFWGPSSSIKSTKWIAESAKMVEAESNPTLTLIYLPHLDYNLQKLGPAHPGVIKDYKAIDSVCEDLIRFYEKRGARIMVLSEYGISEVSQAIHLNRVLRAEGLLAVRTESGRELLDAGASEAFAVADHQIAHIYIKDKQKINRIRSIIENTGGIEMVLGESEKKNFRIHHQRAGDLIAIAASGYWFSYYYWFDERRAPDFARTVEIHRKPGYDPAELFFDPEIRLLYPRLAGKLLKKKLGFRTLMDVIPLQTDLVHGSHGRPAPDPEDLPLVITTIPGALNSARIDSTAIYNILYNLVTDKTNETREYRMMQETARAHTVHK